MALKVCTPGEMRHLDQTASQKYGIKEELLMENAGLAAYRVLCSRADLNGKQVLILCGGGNNGGDGLVLARKLFSAGIAAEVIVLGNPEKYAKAAALNFKITGNLGINLNINPALNKIKKLIDAGHVIVDALFGTGLTRDVEGIFHDTIKYLNASGKKVLSLDIPSGINGETGGINRIAVKADYTITFGLPKIGNLLYPGAGYGGDLYVSHISFPPELYGSEDIKCGLNLPARLPERKPDGHKSGFGKALFIAGAGNYYGAPYMSAYSFLKSGGGMAHLAAPESLIPVVAGLAPELVFHPQAETDGHSLSLTNEQDLLELAAEMDMVILGPGLSTRQETGELVLNLVKKIKVPLLIDADGLNLLAEDKNVLAQRKAPAILTPHWGEFSRLSGWDIPAIREDPPEAARIWAKKLNCFLVLKGARSLIASPSGEIWINPTGNSGMATAGSGDVLTGIIAGLFGLGLNEGEAARSGVFLHGLAGDLAARMIGADGITARDLLSRIPAAIKHLRVNYDSLPGQYYKLI